jgi:Ni2+-binding GTPase involved in maturation of urease and hydrogenase
VEGFTKTVKTINPKVELFKVSCTTGEGIQPWAKWLLAQMKRK